MASIMEDHGIQQPDPMPDRSAELEVCTRFSLSVFV